MENGMSGGIDVQDHFIPSRVFGHSMSDIYDIYIYIYILDHGV